MTEPSKDLLDCTLRDGSYAVNFGFTIQDTRVICRALEAAGFRWIEVGHGVGLNASGAKYGFAAATDEEYLNAAASVLTEARFGAFFIPGIGRKEDLDRASACGMDFVRIGTNVTQSDEAVDFVVYAKRLGLHVSYNAMKSYAVSPVELVQRMHPIVDAGVDTINVVDSAGGMMPNDVQRYVGMLSTELSVDIGFHGHNNLMLAVANSLVAFEAGAAMTDCTLQGLGRGAGNAQSEIMAILCEKRGYHTGVNPMRALESGERIIRSRQAESSGISSLQAVIGMAQFHSSYLPRIYVAAEAYTVNPRKLIIEVSKIDRVDPSEELILRVAAEMARLKENPENE
ncbi:MAG: 4-hydroxy-2-oxovalerate aldolase [Lentisphaerae bacterium]|nr:4-hydroxy-2-oxovalerate aldolase [Lentisphaerota bacterium]